MSQPVPRAGEWGARSSIRIGSMLLPYAAYRVTARGYRLPCARMARMTRVVIVGGGPGGYEAALVAAQLGADVTVVDRDGLGGSCVLTDCVPSKTLIATSEVMTLAGESGELGVRIGGGAPDARPRRRSTSASVNARVKRLASAQSDDIQARLEREGVRVVRGLGRLDGRVARRGRDGRRRDGVVRGRRDPRLDRCPPARGRRRGARRRADPHLGAGLRPRGAARAARRGRVRRHRCGVRLGLQRARLRRRAGLLARPRAARARTPTPRRCSRTCSVAAA